MSKRPCPSNSRWTSFPRPSETFATHSIALFSLPFPNSQALPKGSPSLSVHAEFGNSVSDHAHFRRAERTDRGDVHDASPAELLGAAEKYGFPAVTDDYVFRQDDETKLRIALSRLDLYQSSLTLLDNPFSVLTGERRTAVFVELLPKIVSAVKTALFATDSLEEAFSFADNALFLHEGKIVDSGNLKHFIHDPISLYSDMYVNEDRNFIEVPTDDGGIDFYGKKIDIDNAPQAVTVSFTMIPGEQGSEHSGSIVYGSFGKH